MAATAQPSAAFSLHAMVLAAVEDEVGDSPKEIADHILAQLSDEQVREALAIALPPYVGKCIVRERSTLRHAPRERPEGSGEGRWRNVREDRWEIEILRQRVCPRGVFKVFGECDVRDVLDLGADLKLQSERSARMAKSHEMLARVMNARGHATVADVPKEDLKKIFNA